MVLSSARSLLTSCLSDLPLFEREELTSPHTTVDSSFPPFALHVLMPYEQIRIKVVVFLEN